MNYYLYNVTNIFLKRKYFQGWGRKKTGKFALWCNNKFGGNLTLQEDGFICSQGLRINGEHAFSIVKDDVGIYYDATQPSRLEELLNTYDFHGNVQLMQLSSSAMSLIKKLHISKYNNAYDISDDFFKGNSNDKILIIAQTYGDLSLEYGLGNMVKTIQMIEDAKYENPHASIYMKIHPDTLTGKKKSDFNLNEIPEYCIIIDEDVNPISLLKHFSKVYTKTSGMGMEALILGLEVICYGMPYYAGWGLTTDKLTCDRRTSILSIKELFAGSYILYAHYHNPYTKKDTNIIDTIQSIAKYRDFSRKNSGDLYFFGFSLWKHKNIKSFFLLGHNNIFFCKSLSEARHKGLNNKSKIYIWGKKPFYQIESYAREQCVRLLRVEDGFVRSVSLGSDLTKAYSIVVDSRGIYFDPTQESDLEYILNAYIFDEELMLRSKKLQVYLIKNKISKYNSEKDIQISLYGLQKGQKIIMVPGQVEDDASIVYGANGMTNLELLKQTKKNAPNAYIIYKPHPDVLAGNRKGNIPSIAAQQYCDTIISNASLDSVLILCDEVHTMTSLVGFEALIRGKKVYTYGLPFYAGWGLTQDTKICERRTVKRNLDELVAASLILYPNYIHPKTNLPCEVEALLNEIEKEKEKYSKNMIYRYFIYMRNTISRKTQFTLRFILDHRN